MWLKIAIAVAILLWLMRKKGTGATSAVTDKPYASGEGQYNGPPPPDAAPTGTLDTGPATVTFHEGSGVWDTPWVKPAGGDTGCSVEPDEFGGMRYVCP